MIYDFLTAGDYEYSFIVEDVYGDYYRTDATIFTIDENGEILFNG